MTINPMFDKEYRKKEGISTDPSTSIEIVREHDTECPAEQQGWISPWVFPSNDITAEITPAGALHVNKRSEEVVSIEDGDRWIRLVCNNPQCDGVINLREEEIQLLIRHLLVQRTRYCEYCGEELRTTNNGFERHKQVCKKENVPLEQRIQEEMTVE